MSAHPPETADHHHVQTIILSTDRMVCVGDDGVKFGKIHAIVYDTQFILGREMPSLLIILLLVCADTDEAFTFTIDKFPFPPGGRSEIKAMQRRDQLNLGERKSSDADDAQADDSASSASSSDVQEEENQDNSQADQSDSEETNSETEKTSDSSDTGNAKESEDTENGDGATETQENTDDEAVSGTSADDAVSASSQSLTNEEELGGENND